MKYKIQIKYIYNIIQTFSAYTICKNVSTTVKKVFSRHIPEDGVSRKRLNYVV